VNDFPQNRLLVNDFPQPVNVFSQNRFRVNVFPQTATAFRLRGRYIRCRK
jgi:hypothetical protein